MNNSGLHMDVGSVTEVTARFRLFEERTRAGILLITLMVANSMEVWAKENAPWKDQTSNARRNLKGDAHWEYANMLVATMSHHVDYGPMLELARERRYAILEKSLDKYKDDFMREWQRIIEGVR